MKTVIIVSLFIAVFFSFFFSFKSPVVLLALLNIKNMHRRLPLTFFSSGKKGPEREEESVAINSLDMCMQRVPQKSWDPASSKHSLGRVMVMINVCNECDAVAFWAFHPFCSGRSLSWYYFTRRVSIVHRCFGATRRAKRRGARNPEKPDFSYPKERLSRFMNDYFESFFHQISLNM